MERDDVDVPPIVQKCCEAIEKYGLDQQGLYRINGTHTKVQKLKERLDKGACAAVAWSRARGKQPGSRSFSGERSGAAPVARGPNRARAPHDAADSSRSFPQTLIR